MRSKIPFTLSFAFAATLLHISCCLLPLFSLASTSLPYLNFFTRYRALFAWIQFAVVFYLLVKIVLDQTRIKSFCHKTDRIIHMTSLVIAVCGIGINHYEPFKTENQKLAEQQFMLFRNHRQLEINLSGVYDKEALKKDLMEMKGIKSNRIEISNDTLALTFQSNLVSSQEILSNLRSKGYSFAE